MCCARLNVTAENLQAFGEWIKFFIKIIGLTRDQGQYRYQKRESHFLLFNKLEGRFIRTTFVTFSLNSHLRNALSPLRNSCIITGLQDLTSLVPRFNKTASNLACLLTFLRKKHFIFSYKNSLFDRKIVQFYKDYRTIAFGILLCTDFCF